MHHVAIWHQACIHFILNSTVNSQIFSQLFQSPQYLWSAGLKAAAVLWDGGKRKAGIAAAQANYDEKSAAYKQAVLTGWKEVEDALMQSASFRQQQAEQAKLSALDCPLPLDETPPPLPNGGCLLVRGAAFPQGLPPLQTESDFWLVPLLAQYNGYASATFETAAQCAARADVLDAALAAQRGVGPVFRLMGRTVKNALRKRKESAR